MVTTTLSGLDRTGDFQTVEYIDGYLPIEDYGLIGDGTTAALVGRDGIIDWLCIPRFDAVPVFSSILDHDLGGKFRISAGNVIGARHRYLGDSPILVTEIQVPDGVLRITDLMPLHDQANLSTEGAPNTGELLRCVEVIEGELTVEAEITIRGGVDAERHTNGVRLRPRRYPDLDLVLEASGELDGPGGRWTLSKGESIAFSLRWNGGVGASSVDAPVAAVTNTIEGWLSWLRRFDYNGPQRALVRRSAMVIKLLDYLPSGALVAAPTSSLPEWIGGGRNWDYRYTWVRDAAFAVYSLRRIGMQEEAWQFLNWVLSVCQDRHLSIMYTIDGRHEINEYVDDALSGYRNSAPVRWGNGAHDQLQHDVYGEVLDCAFQWVGHGGIMTEDLWSRLTRFVDKAAELWNTPDSGIWEARSEPQVQTYSAGMCHVALNRGTRLARRFDFSGDIALWEKTAQDIEHALHHRAWNEEAGYFTQGLDGGHLDAAVLGLPLRRVIDAKHPKMVKTAQAIDDQLGAGNGLHYRYDHTKSPDGLEGTEGAFLLVSFWMVDNLTLQGRLQEAMDRFDQLCSRVNTLGLLPEEIDPASGAFLGNFPQAFSHLGLISSGVNLAYALQSRDGADDVRDARRHP